jgi:quercetin 2,3-dioxygenase
MIKPISKIFNPPAYHWVGDGFKMHNFIPSLIPQESISPFVMLDYGAKFVVPPSNVPRGVGVHPHRGMETVTIAYKGKVAHHDSTGSSGIIGQGEVQWMTAGKGVLHKEYHEEEFSKAGGEFQMVQLWVNLPQVHKMTEPKYQAVTKNSIKKVTLPNNAGFIEVISGDYEGNIGPAATFSPINLWNVHLGGNINQPNNPKHNENRDELSLEIAKIESLDRSNSDNSISFETKINLPEKFNTFLIVIEGKIEVNGQKAEENQLVLFKNTGEEITLKSDNSAIILVASGEPINEPIFSYGPFVMNTKQEIIQAFEDLEAGKFGYLE